jgi:uncharacterized protein (TIGR00269 family)
MKCSKCEKIAIMSQKDSDKHLCEKHFVENFEDRVQTTISKEQMLQQGDRIVVALSGGKDSTALLYVLTKILPDKDDITLLAVTIDEGILGYREETINSAKKLTEMLGIPHKIVSFKDEYGWNLDEMVGGKKEAPCTYCGVFRKSLLNRTAKKLCANKVATGHELDDEAQSVLMNYMKGDIERLGRLMPRKIQPGLVPRIKSLKDILERETALYCMVNGIYVKMTECPYASLSFRSDIRDMLNSFENKFSGSKQSIMKGFDNISDLLAVHYPAMKLSLCQKCGEPCVDDFCKACQLKKRIDAAWEQSSRSI